MVALGVVDKGRNVVVILVLDRLLLLLLLLYLQCHGWMRRICRWRDLVALCSTRRRHRGEHAVPAPWRLFTVIKQHLMQHWAQFEIRQVSWQPATNTAIISIRVCHTQTECRSSPIISTKGASS